MLPRRQSVIILHAACIAAAVPQVVRGQSLEASAELGAARLTQREVPRVHAATAGASLRRDGSWYALAAAGGLTLADDGRSTKQGLVAAYLLGRPGRRSRWEVGGALTAFDQGALSSANGAYLIAREHLTVRRFGGWVGVGLGGVTDAGAWSPTRTAELGSWYASRFARLSAAAVLVDTRSEPYGSEGLRITDPVTYTDGSLGARWVIRRRAEFDARAGLRLISRGALTPTGRGTRPFAAVDAAFWITPRVAVVGAMGRQLADLSRGTPDTRFASLALRFAMRTPLGASAKARRAPDTDRPRLILVSDTTGRARLTVAAPTGATVEVAASFTGWQPVALVRRGDAWELDHLIPSGAHRLLVRVDGGAWVVPANLPAAADDFGGQVGIITIP